MAKFTLFSEYLSLLKVPHTRKYSNRRFLEYPPRVAFDGVSDLLDEYNVTYKIYNNVDSAGLGSIPAPFVAKMKDGCIIVTKVTPDEVVSEAYGKSTSLPIAKFMEEWTGTALSATPGKDSREPDVSFHRFSDFTAVADRIVLAAAVAFLAVWFATGSGVFSRWATGVLFFVYAAGIYVCHLLMLKEYHVDSHAADNVCKIIQREGCSTVLHDKGSALFGVYPWCEIGQAFFSVSFLALILAPAAWPYLALISVCCLPYTVWSVSYQKFKVHAWCTLCLTVQSLFWVTFLVCLFGGMFAGIFPLSTPFWLLLTGYVAAFLFIHRFRVAVTVAG